MPVKVCVGCDKEFRTIWQHRKFCTLGCRNRYNNKLACIKAKRPSYCWVCHQPYDFMVRNKKRTCSVACEKILEYNAKNGKVCKSYKVKGR